MKLRLTVNGGTLTGQTFDLESGFLTIGRNEMCTVRFDPMSERIASKQHCFIEAKADGYYLSDNQSTNGTLVNGEVITSAKLSDGDHIQFGRNGITASVSIDPGSDATFLPENFRAQQVQQFNEIAAAGPVSVQNSLSNLGLGSLAAVKPEPEKTATKTYILAVVAIVAVVFLSIMAFFLISVGITSSRTGALTIDMTGIVFAIKASFVAFIPAAIYIIPLLWLDRYDPEPPWLIALAFAWGALVALTFSWVMNTGVSMVILEVSGNPRLTNFITGVVSAPIFEEGSKGLGVVLLLIFFRRYFDDILDGIVFAGIIALGFATTENVQYYGTAISEGGIEGLKASFILRGIVSPFAHVTFTAMTGIGCGLARETHNKVLLFVLPIGGYVLAMTLHGIWNLLATILNAKQWLIGYVVLELPFFFILAAFSFYVMYRQGRILREMLAIDIARGLISQDLGPKVTSVFRSTFWLIEGLFSGKYWARSHYLRACGKLGLSYWHIQRATAAHGQTGSFQQNPILREEVLKWRDQV